MSKVGEWTLVGGVRVASEKPEMDESKGEKAATGEKTGFEEPGRGCFADRGGKWSVMDCTWWRGRGGTSG